MGRPGARGELWCQARNPLRVLKKYKGVAWLPGPGRAELTGPRVGYWGVQGPRLAIRHLLGKLEVGYLLAEVQGSWRVPGRQQWHAMRS